MQFIHTHHKSNITEAQLYIDMRNLRACISLWKHRCNQRANRFAFAIDFLAPAATVEVNSCRSGSATGPTYVWQATVRRMR